jgi:hypothetical protein
VVGLSGVVGREGSHLGDDRSVPEIFGLQLANPLLGYGALLGGVIEDCRAILRSDVAALAIQGRWIVNREKDVE